MAQFHTHIVSEIIENHPDVTKIRLEDGSRAYAFSHITGDVHIGDKVVVNTTAVDLNLGTGGWHFVLWNLEHDDVDTPRGGHIMKARYTPVQLDTGVREEFEDYPTSSDLEGMPVIVAPLHSHIPAIASYLKSHNPDLTIAVAISDGAALPVALSDLLRTLKDATLVDSTISFGHSFGGDIEAINVYTALISAKHLAQADVAIVTMGPGIVGTNTQFGFTGIEVAHHLDAAHVLNARTYGVLRCSEADPRERHRGISHHAITTYSRATHNSHRLAHVANHDMSSQMEEQLASSGITTRHDVSYVDQVGVVGMMEQFGLSIFSMGRTAREDELFFEAACAPAQRVLEDSLHG
jgi:hypothetical protein